MDAQQNESDQLISPNECEDCSQSFKTAQGLAGHRRLAHSASTRQELEESRRSAEQRAAEFARSSETVKRREAAVARREREIAETGPGSIGLNQCEHCRAWFENEEGLESHAKAVHPIEQLVAQEAGVRVSRVDDVWVEAIRKSKRLPRASPEEVIGRFWDEKDREVLNRLREHGAVFEEAE
jgi:uncharacterized protein YdaT